ncbi:Peptidase A1 [Corchorus capsularis]|uniref:Peptidase A1 n=1 Tax=Corchorus capsularis TaxID=210143 RepID=A0A1R3IJ09_COCAP|nr:Peptidase A1 [Corchorus capsularis]
MASIPFCTSFDFFIILLITAASTASTIKMPLSPFLRHTSTDHRYQILNNLANSSLSRAHRLKHHPDPQTNAKTNINSSNLPEAPLYIDNDGGYIISLGFGTPPQSLIFVIDIGSSFTWFPCCTDCDQPMNIPVFSPKLSSSMKFLPCDDPKCSWLFGPEIGSTCRDECKSPYGNFPCSPNCPDYNIEYPEGYNTSGFLLEESLVFPQKTFYNILVGCSTNTDGLPGPGGLDIAGIVGFSRSSQSFPSQLGVKKFAYCLISRQLDNPDVSSTMWFETESGSSDTKTPGLSYTPLNKNQVASFPVLKELNYVKLRRIIVGNKDVKVPYRYLVPGSDGNYGGTVVDLLTEYTFMEKPVFELVSQEFVKQMRNYSNTRVYRIMFDPCFYVAENESIHVPELVFQFKGGARMKLPTANYFSFVSATVACLMIVTDSQGDYYNRFGPAIILGNFQQQNYYVEFDLANDRFGFAERSCL